MLRVVISAGIGLVGLGFLIYEIWQKNRFGNRTEVARTVTSRFDGSNTEICVLCLEEFRFTSDIKLSLPCNHVFHRSCITQVFNQMECGALCPVCRASVSETFIRNANLRFM